MMLRQRNLREQARSPKVKGEQFCDALALQNCAIQEAVDTWCGAEGVVVQCGRGDAVASSGISARS